MVRNFHQHRPGEHALVELARALNVSDSESHVRNGGAGQAHRSHRATPSSARCGRARIAVVRIAMTMPVMEPDLDAAVLRNWARLPNETALHAIPAFERAVASVGRADRLCCRCWYFSRQ